METGRLLSSFAPVYTINQRLDTKEQIGLPVEDYLKPLRSQLPPDERAIHEEGLPTVVFA
ncbi:MAG: hypothetical protein OXN97_21250 [Bryobacterales bacterium]|nr:hypothetical protein [Bryobacterales bacterium]MDE0626054.1 hypothetical protein [Bryobacterales bacterium]